MNSSQLMQQAQQGNVAAIQTLLQRSLPSSHQITRADFHAGRLVILVEALESPNAQLVCDRCRQVLQPLHLTFINTLQIHGRKLGEEFFAWTQEVNFRLYPSSSSIDVASDSRSLSSQETHKASFNRPSPLANRTPSIEPMAIVPGSSPTDDRQSPLDPALDPALNQSPTLDSETPDFLRHLRTFRFEQVVPYRQALSPELYGDTAVKLLLFFSLFPLAISLGMAQLRLQVGLRQTAWVLGLYYASIWGVVLYALIRPGRLSWQNILKCAGFTIFVGIPLLLTVQNIPPFNLLYAAIDFNTKTDLNFIFRLVGFVLGVGLLEEVCKALPVYFFLLRSGELRDPLTAAFYGSISGLGFAISEGVVYSMLYARGLVEGEISVGAYALVSTIRFVCLPLFHAIWAGIVGYFLGLAAINPARQSALIFIGIAIAATLHGLYNTFSSQLSAIAVIGFSILLFVAYLRHSYTMVSELEQAEHQAKTKL
ncbi:MAG: PrsW family glutamic-type intramembrane protease [Synechococcales bacterium]|nr:PrsW family glutamic-type intramembrane protease [Synechococcales bacterium]